jgi:hypothetical protein
MGWCAGREAALPAAECLRFGICKLKIMDERSAITDLGRALTALLEESAATPACQAIAVLMVAAQFARRAEMPPNVAETMLSDFWVKGQQH